MAKFKKAAAGCFNKAAKLQVGIVLLVVINTLLAGCICAEMRISGCPEVGVLTPIQVVIPEITEDSYEELSSVMLDYSMNSQVMAEAIKKAMAEIPAIAERKEEGINIVGDIENFHTSVDGFTIRGFLGDGTDCEGVVYVNVYNPEQVVVGGFAMKIFFTNLPTDLASDVN